MEFCNSPLKSSQHCRNEGPSVHPFIFALVVVNMIQNTLIPTAWKVSKYGVISGPYFPVFGLNTEIYFLHSVLINNQLSPSRRANISKMDGYLFFSALGPKPNISCNSPIQPNPEHPSFSLSTKVWIYTPRQVLLRH